MALDTVTQASDLDPIPRSFSIRSATLSDYDFFAEHFHELDLD